MCEDGQHLVQPVEHGVIGEAHDLGASAPQVCFASLVITTTFVVHGPIDFDDEA